MSVSLVSKKDDAAEREQVEQIELFSLDGQSYYIPKKVKANTQLKYLRALREEGELQATYILLRDVLTPEGYDALAEYDDLSEQDLEQIMDIAQKVALGGTEEDDTKEDGSHSD